MYLAIKICILALVAIAQLFIGIWSTGKLLDANDQLTKRGILVIVFASISSILGFGTLLVDSAESNADKLEAQAATRQALQEQKQLYSSEIRELHDDYYVKLDSSDKANIRLLAEYDLHRNVENTRIVRGLDSAKSGQPLIIPHFFTDSINIKNNTLFYRMGVGNVGSDVAYDIEVKIYRFVLYNGNYLLKEYPYENINYIQQYLGLNSIVHNPYVESYYGSELDSLFFFFDISYRSFNNSIHHDKHVYFMVPKHKTIHQSYYYVDEKLKKFMRNRKWIK